MIKTKECPHWKRKGKSIRTIDVVIKLRTEIELPEGDLKEEIPEEEFNSLMRDEIDRMAGSGDCSEDIANCDDWEVIDKNS